jgi:hypothetical protein
MSNVYRHSVTTEYEAMFNRPSIDEEDLLVDYFNQRRNCFTENYLVFNLNEKMP